MRAVLIAGVLLLAAPAGASARADVLLYGDSLAVGTQPYLAPAMPDQRVRFDVAVSRHADEGPRDLERRRRLPDTLMISLGTNDDPNDVAGFKSAVRATMRLAGRDRCVVWSDILRPAVDGTGYGALNRALERQAKRRPNLVTLRWRRMVRRHPEWLAGDGVHVSAQGYEARARAYGRAARKCA